MNISVLALAEPVRVNEQRVDAMVQELGETGARNVLGLAVEQIAVTLSKIQRMAQAGDQAAVVARTERLARLAWQVGLVTLSGVAIDVGTCVERCDGPGFAATLARLLRVGNRSVTEIWEGRDFVD